MKSFHKIHDAAGEFFGTILANSASLGTTILAWASFENSVKLIIILIDLAIATTSLVWLKSKMKTNKAQARKDELEIEILERQLAELEE